MRGAGERRSKEILTLSVANIVRYRQTFSAIIGETEEATTQK